LLWGSPKIDLHAFMVKKESGLFKPLISAKSALIGQTAQSVVIGLKPNAISISEFELQGFFRTWNRFFLLGDNNSINPAL